MVPKIIYLSKLYILNYIFQVDFCTPLAQSPYPVLIMDDCIFMLQEFKTIVG